MKRLPLVVVAAAFFSTGCQDQQLPTMPPAGEPSFEIADGFSRPNTPFFFLWPIRPLNQPPPATGFNPNLRPVVEICRLTSPGTCGDVVATLTMTSGSPLLNRVFVLRDRKEYAALWVAKNLVAGKSYRIRVVVGGKVLGFADLDVLTTLKAVLAYPDRSNFVPLLRTFDGSALPIRFWIGDGAFGAADPDHVEATVTNAGGTITTNTGFAGASFPDNWLPATAVSAGINEVVVIIERVPVDNSNAETSCLRSGLLEMEGCYRFRTEPALTGPFNKDVTAALCFEIPSVIGTPDAPPFQLHRREDGDGLFGPTFPLEDAPAGFVHCETFTRTPSPSPRLTGSSLGGVRDLASAGWHAIAGGIARLLRPRAVYAVDLGAGGLTRRFSHFGWARAATIRVLSEADQSAVLATAVPSVPTVKVVIRHHGETAVEGAQVLFTVVGGGGKVAGLDISSVTTLADGMASVPWSTGSSLTETENKVMVSTPFVDNSPIFFTAKPLIRQNDPQTDCSADLASGYGYRIDFNWADVPGASVYRIAVERQGSQLQAVNTVVQGGSQYTVLACNGFVADLNLTGWRWQFRTEDGGIPGAWSPWFSFAFAPCRLSNGSACFAPSGGQ